MEMLPDLIRQFSTTMEKAIAQDIERRIGAYSCSRLERF